MNQRMLVVEDEENVRESIAVLLEVEGYEVCTAKNGAEALRLLSGESSSDASANGGSANGEGRSKRSPFSLIILDLMMPQMDGWSFRARQLQQPGLRDIPVVVLSGAYQIEREVRALNPAAVLRKPVGINDLLDTLAPFLEPKLEA